MMKSLQIGWVDYSKEHRSKVMSVLDLLNEKGAVDELGIGMIRDGFGDVLFPGTSTIQTRAKYHFIIPYIMMELEKETFSTVDGFLEALAEKELDIVELFSNSNEDGVIGQRAGRSLKRRPSSIYWNALQTFEIFKYPNISQNNYAKMAIEKSKNIKAAKNYGLEDSAEHKSMVHGSSYDFWNCPIPDPNWKHDLTMSLNEEEAKHLKERIITSPYSSESLMAFILNQDSGLLRRIESFDQIGEVYDLPPDLKQWYDKAYNMSLFLEGANIRYNYLLSNKENDKAYSEWRRWLSDDFVKYEFSEFNFKEILVDLKISNYKLRNFLESWQTVVTRGLEEEIDELILKREIQLKTKERAKLYNTKYYGYEAGTWLGAQRLSYRFKDTKTILLDIFDGLEGEHD